MIVSPMATGNGAYILHKTLEKSLPDYQVVPYDPNLTLFPLSLFFKGRFLKADLIHTVPDYGIFHSRGNIPLVLTFHNYVLDLFMKDYSSLLQNIHYQTDLKWFTRQSVNNAMALTAVSRFTSDLVQEQLNLTNKRIRVIYNGIDHRRFYPGNTKSLVSKEIRVFFSGNLTKRKGAHWLIPILEKLSPEIKVFYTLGLRTKNILPDNSRLVCLGSIKHEEMPAMYNSMDILLFPTVREGFGLSAVEAMACGLPVVATNCSALPEIIDNGKGGFLCGLGDVDDFAQKINLLAENPMLRRQMGEYNRAKVEQCFTLDRMVREYADLFEELLLG